MRNRSRLRLAPVTIRPVPNVRDLVFEALIAGEAMVESILDADRVASTGREYFDDAYYAAFFKSAEPILARRLSESASAVASVIVAAWTEAGRPAMPTGSAGPARIRR
jgi:hypothetical protein